MPAKPEDPLANCVIYILAGVLVIAGAIWVNSWWSDLGSDPGPSTVTRSAPSTRTVVEGAVGYLSLMTRGARGTRADLMVTVTRADYDALMQAGRVGDSVGIRQLVASGRAFKLPHNTKVLVLQGGVLYCEVRVLTGQHTGRSGWIETAFVYRKEQ